MAKQDKAKPARTRKAALSGTGTLTAEPHVIRPLPPDPVLHGEALSRARVTAAVEASLLADLARARGYEVSVKIQANGTALVENVPYRG
jgi:hypothetical protein